MKELILDPETKRPFKPYGLDVNIVIPYKNKRGHWVWRLPEHPEDKSWPGIRPPTKDAVPTRDPIDKNWYWVT